MTPRTRAGGGSPVTILCCPDGPFLVRGASSIIDEGGREHPTARPVVAVCRCGKSARRPWCDGTHKVIGREPAAE